MVGPEAEAVDRERLLDVGRGHRLLGLHHGGPVLSVGQQENTSHAVALLAVVNRFKCIDHSQANFGAASLPQRLDHRKQLDFVFRGAPEQRTHPLGPIVEVDKTNSVPLIQFFKQELERFPEQLNFLPSHRPTAVQDADQVDRRPLYILGKSLSFNVDGGRNELGLLGHTELSEPALQVKTDVLLSVVVY